MPRTLKPILALREQLKARAKELPPDEAAPYKERQTALKWMLVTCFGYLGYKNARFGRIEAHEAVTAHGRDKLLTAKEISEAAGYTVLHGLTDCLWLQKSWREADPGWRENALALAGTGVSPCPSPPNVHASPGAHPRLMNSPLPPFFKGGFQVPLRTGVVRGIRNVHRLPAVPAPGGAALHYSSEGDSGIRRNWQNCAKKSPRPPGSSWPWKASTAGSASCPPGRTPSGRWPRGISGSSRTAPSRSGGWPAAAGTRRLSCAGPRRRLLAKMAEAVTPEDLEALKPELAEMAEGFRQRLREGRVRPLDLVITRVLSQKVEDYKVDTPTVPGGPAAASRGHPLTAGRKGALRPRRTEGRPQGDPHPGRPLPGHPGRLRRGVLSGAAGEGGGGGDAAL